MAFEGAAESGLGFVAVTASWRRFFQLMRRSESMSI
jgi:hypothetical protein